MARVGVVIPAGGRGLRLGRRIPKQFLLLLGKPVLQWTVAIFDSLPIVDEIVVVAPAAHIARVKRIISRAGFRKVSAVVPGGAERQDSVRNGLNSFTRHPDVVLVHDAVRPLVTPEVVRAVVRAAARYRAAVVGVPVKDTVKVEGRKGFYARTLQRDRLWVVQTPQGFDYGLLLRAHKLAQGVRFVGTDESSLVERLGVPARIVPGDERNFKITTKGDLERAKLLMRFVA